MIQTDDVAAFMLSRWTAAGMNSTVPGLLWNGPPLETAVSPYAVMKVTRNAGTEYTSALELPHFNVEVGVMIDQTTSTAAQGVEIAVGVCFPLIPAATTLRTGSVIHMEPQECSADVSFPMRAKTDVVAARFAWNVWCAGTLP